MILLSKDRSARYTRQVILKTFIKKVSYVLAR